MATSTTHKALAVWAPNEIASMIQDYAKKHEMALSEAALTLIAKGLKVPKPVCKPVGRPAKP